MFIDIINLLIVIGKLMAQKLNKDHLKYYSHIVINKTKRTGFLMLFSVIYLLMIAALMNHMLQGNKSWVLVAVPICILSIPLILFPPVEEWVYKPWQAKAQKYERHYRN